MSSIDYRLGQSDTAKVVICIILSNKKLKKEIQLSRLFHIQAVNIFNSLKIWHFGVSRPTKNVMSQVLCSSATPMWEGGETYFSEGFLDKPSDKSIFTLG